MKLPPFQGSRRAQLPRQNLAPAVQQQRNKLGVLDAVVNLGQNIAQQHREMQVAEQNSAYGDYVNQVEQELASVQTLTPQQLRDAGLSETDGVQLKDAGGADRDAMMRHEWYPQLVNKRMQEASERFGNKIMDRTVREAWVRDQNTRREDYVTRLTKQSADDANRYMMQQAEAKNRADLEMGNYQSIIDRVNTVPGYAQNPVEKQMWVQRAETGRFVSQADNVLQTGSSEQIMALQETLVDRETDLPISDAERTRLAISARNNGRRVRGEELDVYSEPYREAIRRGDNKTMQQQLEYLQAEDYGSNPSDFLTADENIALQNELRSGIRMSTSKVTAQINAEVSRLTQGINDAIGVMDGGGYLDPLAIGQARDYISEQSDLYKVAGKEAPLEHFNRVAKFNKLVEQNERRRGYMSMPHAERTEKLQGLQLGSSTESNIEYQLAKESDKAIDEALTTNPFATVRMLGLDMNAEPLPNDPFSFEYLDALPNRWLNAENISGHYGEDIDLLDEVEIVTLSNAMDNADPNTNLDFMGGVAMKMGPDGALQFWDAAEYGDAYMPVVAGMMVAEGRYSVGEEILAGHQLLKGEEGQAPFKIPYENQATAYLIENMGDAFGDPFRRNNRRDAIMAVYAKRLAESGEIDTNEFDSELLDSAMNAVMGGEMVEINGVTQEPPDKNVTQDQVDRWVSQLVNSRNADDLPEFDPVENHLSKPEVSKGLRSGRYTLTPSGKRGVWYIMDNQGTVDGERKGGLLRDATGMSPAEVVWSPTTDTYIGRRR